MMLAAAMMNLDSSAHWYPSTFQEVRITEMLLYAATEPSDAMAPLCRSLLLTSAQR